MRTVEQLNRAVDKGWDALTNYDVAWFRKVDISTLDIYSLDLCVLAQVFPEIGYALSLERLDLRGRGIACGFDGRSSCAVGDYDKECKELTRIWRQRITEAL